MWSDAEDKKIDTTNTKNRHHASQQSTKTTLRHVQHVLSCLTKVIISCEASGQKETAATHNSLKTTPCFLYICVCAGVCCTSKMQRVIW